MSATGSERGARTRAGPSKPVAKPKRKQTTNKELQEEESDDLLQVDSADDDEVTEVDPPQTRKLAPRPVNGKSTVAKGKGKAKADSAASKKLPSRADIEVVDHADDVGPSGTARAINDATNNNKATKRVENSSAVTKENDRLRRQLESASPYKVQPACIISISSQAQAHIKDLTKQLEESYRVRYTEPEELQRRQVEKYEEIIRSKYIRSAMHLSQVVPLAKDLLLKQQEEMLSRKEPLSKEGKGSVLHMVTREAADAEKRSAEEQVTYWKGQVDARDRLLEEKDQNIAELKQSESDLKYEVKTERELSQKMSQQASQHPPSAQRSRGPHAVLGSDDPKHAELVSFYEDVTNLLVTDVKIQEPKYFALDEWILTCVYTHAPMSENSRSLGFLLRFTYDPVDASAPVESVEDLEKAAQYTPLHLDQESDEFIEALNFLNNGFAFPRKQLPIFFSSLVENMKVACEGPAPESDQENESMDVELVE
ncbi:hypothetical protein B0H11DRAFT_1175657 [Mycena galericulata]|nr:hypothetical protein B0H11DRAFT_1175657 [Mycena galericulata]